MADTFPKYVLLNDKIVRADRACISVFDRGLQYGDGLFETLRAYRGRLFAVDEHMARVSASARFLGIKMPRVAWDTVLVDLLDKNGLRGDAWVRLLITRGTAAPGLLPPRHMNPTVIAIAGQLDPHLGQLARRGVRVELLPFAVEGPLAGHKALNYMPALLGKQVARRQGAYEGLYVDRRGRLSEGTTSNLFVVDGEKILTPPAAGILPGVTRHKVIDLSRTLGLVVKESGLSTVTLLHADEAFLSSSLAEIVPITRVGGTPIGSGRPGSVTKRLQAAFRLMIRETLGV